MYECVCFFLYISVDKCVFVYACECMYMCLCYVWVGIFIIKCEYFFMCEYCKREKIYVFFVC